MVLVAVIINTNEGRITDPEMLTMIDIWLETNEPSVKFKDDPDWDKQNDNRAVRTMVDIRG